MNSFSEATALPTTWSMSKIGQFKNIRVNPKGSGVEFLMMPGEKTVTGKNPAERGQLQSLYTKRPFPNRKSLIDKTMRAMANESLQVNPRKAPLFHSLDKPDRFVMPVLAYRAVSSRPFSGIGG